MKASDLFLQCLEANGVTSIYGVPGEENADMMISLLNASLQFYSTRHEQTASFMAEMHGRLTGRPGVCMGTLGPGATNLLTGVAQANMDNSPLVAIIGQAETERLHKESHQNMDAVSMYRSVTKWATTIRDADVIPEVIAKAFKVATSGIPGAVLIELPEDIAKHNSNEQPFAITDHTAVTGTTTGQISHLLKLIHQAETPVVLVGDGAVREECDRELKAFLEHTGLYSAHTFMGKGAVDHRYERSLHCVGMGMKDLVIEAFEQADLVIAIGYDMVEYPPARWNTGKSKQIVHINTAYAEVDQHYLPDQEIVGNIRVILEQMNTALDEQGASIRKADAYFSEQQQRIEHDIRADRHDDSYPMRPKRLLYDIRDTLGEQDILVSDVGAHKMWVARQYGARASKTCFISNGFCSMGGSMPAALEARRLRPDRNVVALCGDGGFMMSIQALVTGVQYNIPFTVIVWEDDYYGLIKWKQEMAYNTCSHVDLCNPDLVQLARAYGCYSRRIDAAADFQPALARALQQQDQPAVLVVPVDYSENMQLFRHLQQVVH